MTTATTDPASVLTTERLQLALNVSNLDEAVEFYGKLFDAKPAKLRDGYANFAIASPPLKLVLIESPEGGTINHLGVEVASTEAVTETDQRVNSVGLETREEMAVECCYALQDKVWLDGPDKLAWEIYTVLGDSNVMSNSECCAGEEACC